MKDQRRNQLQIQRRNQRPKQSQDQRQNKRQNQRRIQEAVQDLKEPYYLVREKAVPEVLLKVLEAKRLMEQGHMTVQQATEAAGISRSSFYKYQDDIQPFRETAQGRTITLVLQICDEAGVLSDILQVIAGYRGNILTIHQAIPLHDVATLTVSVDFPPESDCSGMLRVLEERPGVRDLRILGGDPRLQ